MRLKYNAILSNKIPRGIIYHSIWKSVRYVIFSLIMPLHSKELVKEAEEEFARLTHSKTAIAFSHARTAIFFALRNQKFNPGDEILMSPVTIKGIFEVVLALGLKPIFVDFAPGTACFDVKKLERKIGAKTVGCIITPLFGMMPDLGKMQAILKKNNVFTIIDFSQCLNGRIGNKTVNNFADVGVYSASSLKTIDTLGGGFLTTNSETLARKLRHDQEKLRPTARLPLIKKAIINLIRNCAVHQLVFSTSTFWYLRLLSVISPENSLKQTGKRKAKLRTDLPSSWFTRYSSLQARLLLEEIKMVDANDQVRIKNAHSIMSSIPYQKKFLKDEDGSRSVFWQLIYVTNNNVAMQNFMAKQGIDVASSSLSFLPALVNLESECRNALHIYNNGIFIPHTHLLTSTDLLRIRTAVQQYAELEGD